MGAEALVRPRAGPAAEQAPRPMAAIVLAGSIGTIIEWYDFLIYGTAAALAFNTLFFPGLDPLAGTLAALGTYAAGFVARPLGGVLFGHFGDRLGRKATLTATMSTMALGTFGIGLLPTYAQAGLWAPALLVALRLVQGIGLGGEWGGASLVVVEHAPAGRRGFYGSLVQIGFPLGLLASAGVFALLGLLPAAALQAWGWRVPFLLSIALLGVGWFVRARIPETPHFQRLQARGEVARAPLAELLATGKRGILVALGLKITEATWVYMLTVFAVVYATANLGLPKSLLLGAIAVAAGVEVLTIPLFGWASDRLGFRALYLGGAAFTACFCFPLFSMLDTRDPTLVTLAVVVALNLGHGVMFAPQSAVLPALFGARVRYTGASLGFQAAAALGGGLAPILATALVGVTGKTAGVSLMLAACAAMTFAAALSAPALPAPEAPHDALAG